MLTQNHYGVSHMTQPIQLDSNILRAKDVKSLCNCSRQHAYDLMRKLPRIQLGTLAWGVFESDLKNYLEQITTAKIDSIAVAGGSNGNN
jgi:predicted DNA-binding transcriptional regulator AlpA